LPDDADSSIRATKRITGLPIQIILAESIRLAEPILRAGRQKLCDDQKEPENEDPLPSALKCPNCDALTEAIKVDGYLMILKCESCGFSEIPK
jgi:hypothetical protein